MTCRAEPIQVNMTSQIFDSSFLSSPIIPTYSCSFYCIDDNNVHNIVTIIYTACTVNRILPVQNLYMKYCYLYEHLHHHHHFKLSLRLRISLHLPIVTSNYSCIMLMNFLNILIKIATYYSQNYAAY